MKNFSRRSFIKTSGALAAAGMFPGVGMAQELKGVTGDTVRLGLLHSLTGTFAISEAAMVDAEQLAIEEINAAGGVLGRKIVAYVEDGASDAPIFAEKARVLLRRHNVVAIVGCYSSALRKAVLPAMRQAKGVLYYPTYYEGLEQDPHCLYTAQEATQSVVAAMDWMIREKGKKIFLVGSDYIYPVTCNKIAKPTIAKFGGEVVGEEYIPLGHTEFSSVINKIKAAKPDCIYSTVVGGSNVAFYKQLRAAGLDESQITLLSTLVTENEIDGIGKDSAEGTYSCMGYFQSLDNPANKRFLTAFKEKYGQNRVVGYPMECAYNSVYLWKAAVEKANSFAPADVISASSGLSFEAPGGLVRFDDKNHHVWMKVRIGRARSDGQFDVVYETPDLVQPNPFPNI